MICDCHVFVGGTRSDFHTGLCASYVVDLLRQWTSSSLVQVMACRLFGTKPLPQPMIFFLITPLVINFNEIWIKIQTYFIQENAFENDVCKMAAILYRPQCVHLSYMEGILVCTKIIVSQKTCVFVWMPCAPSCQMYEWVYLCTCQWAMCISIIYMIGIFYIV